MTNTNLQSRAAKGWETRRANAALRAQSGQTSAVAAMDNVKKTRAKAKTATVKKHTRRTTAAAADSETMLCSCGSPDCNKVLKIAKNPDKQKFFAQGHDAKAKSFLCEFEKKRIKADEIPAILIERASQIKFIQAMPRFRKIMAEIKAAA